MNHTHVFMARRAFATVAVCDCGQFRYTEYGLSVLPIVVGIEKAEGGK